MTSYPTLIETLHMFYRFQVIANNLSKVIDFNLPHLQLAPPLVVALSPFGICRYIWHQKTRVPGLSCSIVCVIICLAVLVEHRRVTDRLTDSETDTQRWHILC